ncbi:DoxX family protein [Micromonospora sp. R77]|uniref:DoxX family protein n=1 Tax=Micromonospora sp. R77 TaxID=2925836 RepID=UPI001F60579C|nr:DoxX family protein [Micromonospora sp. R77]MCI4061464.1 DoxX family protein [Micromonospora sp. R77]
MLLALVGGGLGRRQEVADAWAKVWAMHPVRNWVAESIFGTTLSKRFDGGDDRFAWVGQFCWLAVAAVAAPVWTALDRSRAEDEDAWRPWFDLAVRMCLAGQLFYYGAAKAVPLQFQLPLARLVEPFGNFSPMTVLWSQSAYSETYQRLLGCAEIAAGALLVVPKTTHFGALVSAAEMGHVLFLNMTFDVPVKIHSSHLLLLSLVLLAPESQRFVQALLTDHAVIPTRRRKPFRSHRANQIAAAAEVIAGGWVLGAQLRNAWTFWKNHGSGREKPALYGIWNVDEFLVNGQQLPPLTTEGKRWRRFIVESADTVTVQRMDDALDNYLATIDTQNGSIILFNINHPQQSTTLALENPAEDQLALEGEIDGRQVKLRMHRVDLESFPLVSRRFHWIQEEAYWR